MKRVSPDSHAPLVPNGLIESASVVSLCGPTALLDEGGDEYASGCLGCPDEPCIRFSAEEIRQTLRIEGPFDPSDLVCPTDSIRMGSDRQVTINEASCVGCGLCAVRCPLGAIHIDPASIKAKVSACEPGKYHRVDQGAEEFERGRQKVSSLLRRETAPFEDAGFVSRQLLASERYSTETINGRWLALLVRNASLLGGEGARLQVAGDHNAVCELITEVGSTLGLVEIEPGVQYLDALRRAVAGFAVAVSRYAVASESLRSAVVVLRSPNMRVDYYQVIADLVGRLGLRVETIPLSVLLLAIRDGGRPLLSLIEVFAGDKPLEVLQEEYGQLPDLVEAGMEPPK